MQVRLSIFFQGIMLLCLLSGCGFHLKGLEPLDPRFKTMVLMSQEFEVLEDRLIDQFAIRGVELLRNSSEPQFALVIVNHEDSIREPSDEQLILRTSVTFLVNDKEGKTVMNPNTVSAETSVTFNSNDSDSQDNTEEAAFLLLHRDIISQIYQRLKAL